MTEPGVGARGAAPPAPIRWGLGDFAWAWPATIFGQIVIGVIVVTARGASPHYKADAIDIAAITAGSAVLTVGLLRAFVVTRGRGSLFADLGLTVRLSDWPWLAAGVLLQVVALGMVALIEVVKGSAPKQEVVTAIQHSGTAARVLGAVAVVVFAPVAEELLFRGLLLRGLLRRYGAAVAVVLGGVAFAVVHLLDPSAAPLLAPLAMVGVLSGILAVRSGDLSRSILLHAGFNLLSAVPHLRDLIRRREPLTCANTTLIPRIIPGHPPIILQKIRPNRRHLNHTGNPDDGDPGHEEIQMQCSRCAKQGMVEIRMKIAGEDVMFHSCGRCESKTWSSSDGPMSLDRVLDMARTH